MILLCRAVRHEGIPKVTTLDEKTNTKAIFPDVVANRQ
jgi:hypothetical protein